MPRNRDDFNKPTIELLAKRVGYLCSNPGCSRPTVGANSDPDRASLIGVAAHITAASPGGPRYSSTLQGDERKHASNGIWLCQNCARLIDVDPGRFSVELLKDWKQVAEQDSLQRLSEAIVLQSASEKIPKLEAELKWISSGKGPLEVSQKHFEKYGQHSSVPLGGIIWNNKLKWMYTLELLNNTNYTAFNIKLHFPNKHYPFTYIDNLGKSKSLKGLERLPVRAHLEKVLVGTAEEALAAIRERFPNPIDSIEFVVEYIDAVGRIYYTMCKFENGELENAPLQALPNGY